MPIVAAAVGRSEEAPVADVGAVTVDANASAALPIHVNARVERWIERFQTSKAHEFRSLMASRGTYEALIREKLGERGMPQELLYLAMIESGLSPWAESRVSAVGVWQFMSPTALQYGLRVDEYVDERRDPVRATDAALDYLAWLHDRFGSWYLAAAAYNAGPGRVERILNRHADGRRGDESLYWEIWEYLPRETRHYVPRLLAVAVLSGEAEAAGEAVRGEAPFSYDRVFVPGTTTLAHVADALDVDARVIRELNPHLTRGVTPPGEMYGVRIPVGGADSVLAALSAGRGADRVVD